MGRQRNYVCVVSSVILVSYYFSESCSLLRDGSGEVALQAEGDGLCQAMVLLQDPTFLLLLRGLFSASPSSCPQHNPGASSTPAHTVPIPLPGLWSWGATTTITPFDAFHAASHLSHLPFLINTEFSFQSQLQPTSSRKLSHVTQIRKRFLGKGSFA